MDYIIRQFKNKLVKAINQENLPIEVKRMCLQEILIEVNQVTERVIEEQKKELEVKNDGNTDETGTT